jgi:hypothetical protein
MIDAVLHIDDNARRRQGATGGRGTKRPALPTDLPEWTAAYQFFRRWHDQRLPTALHDRLRRACRVGAGA